LIGRRYRSAGGLSPAAYGRRAANRLAYGPGMAMDLELDETDENVRQQELDESDSAMEANIADLVAWCKKSLSEKDISRVINMLLEHNGAMDGAVPFFGGPRTGGTNAMDSTPRRRAREMNVAEAQRLDELVPGLARIKII
jgi:hypothetical protein